MPTQRSFLFDLKLPQTPPTEDPALYEQLQYVYKAILTLADTFQTASSEFLSEVLVAGSNVTLTTDLGIPSITIAVPAENIQDLVAAFTVAGSGISVTYDDTANTLTFSLKLTEQTPASAGATGVKGTVVYDSSYLYICVATNTWRRIAHATW